VLGWKVDAQLDHPLALNGQIVKDLLSPVLLKGWKLIYAVDEWICTAKAKGSAET
jgi:hypothetical protein